MSDCWMFRDSNVEMVQSSPPQSGGKDIVLQTTRSAENEAERPDLCSGQVGEFNLAKSGGICPANRD